MDTGGNSYFAAGSPTDLGVELAGLEALRQFLFGKKQGNPYQPLPFNGQPYSPVIRSMKLQGGVPIEQLANPPAKLPKRRAYMMHPIELADDRRDLLNDIENTIYGGGNAPAPTPTPTPQTRMMPVSFFT